MKKSLLVLVYLFTFGFCPFAAGYSLTSLVIIFVEFEPLVFVEYSANLKPSNFQ